jgi:hypothetical protein
VSARTLLRLAAEEDLFTGEAGNPWGVAYSYEAGEASVEVTVALWEAGLLRLPTRREASGRRRWRLTLAGRLALLTSMGGPPGFMPTVGGPYDEPARKGRA